ncbi:MAG: hypothetical protein ACI4U5_04190 [Bacilli bacterium]
MSDRKYKNKMYIVFLGLYTFYYFFTFVSELIISFSSINLFINLFLIAIPLFIAIFLGQLIFSKNQKEDSYLHMIKTGGLVYCFLITFLSLIETLFYYNCESIYEFFSSILLIDGENIIEEINYMHSIAPYMLIQTLFYGFFSVSMYRIYSFKNNDLTSKYNYLSFIIINTIYIIFLIIGFIFMINNKINIFNIVELYLEKYKNVLVICSIFLEISFRLVLNILFIKSFKEKG